MVTKKKEKIINLTEKYPKNFYWKVRDEFPDVFCNVKNSYNNINTFSEKLYLHLHGEKNKKCLRNNCKKDCKFLNFKEGYRTFCSNKCKGLYKTKKSVEFRTCEECDDKFQTKKKSDQFLCSNECRYEYQKRDNIKSKMVKKAIETQRKKYGGVGFESEELRKKIEKTNLKRHGNKRYTNREKFVETMKDEYGGVGAQSNEIKRKINKTKKESFYNRVLNGDRLKKYIKPLFSKEKYVKKGYSSKFKFKCRDCGNIFEDKLENGRVPRCFNCNPIYQGESSSENEVFEYIKSLFNKNEIINQNERDIANENLEFDIFLPNYNIAVEYNGLYWHSELKGKDKNYHLKKTKKCEKNNIKLIHIFENEWKHKKKIVKNKLKHLFGKTDFSIYARNCYIDEISFEEKQYFLDENHLQGNDSASHFIGLINNGEIVGVLSFSNPRFSDEKGLEISRFCTSKHVIGGFGKLFKNYLRENPVDRFITYADRRYSNRSNVFENFGFDFIKYTNPNYWYFENGSDKLYHRFNFRRGVLNKKLKSYDSELTEWENMQRNGYNRIWDCGNIKYEFYNN